MPPCCSSNQSVCYIEYSAEKDPLPMMEIVGQPEENLVVWQAEDAAWWAERDKWQAEQAIWWAEHYKWQAEQAIWQEKQDIWWAEHDKWWVEHNNRWLKHDKRWAEHDKWLTTFTALSVLSVVLLGIFRILQG